MDKGGRITGMIVFIVGIVGLILVLIIAFSLFMTPPTELLMPPEAPPEAVDATGLVNMVVILVIRILLLFIMALASSLVAARGIQLYLGSSECARSTGGYTSQNEETPSQE